MSAHGPMPRSAWIFPALAVLLFATATAFGYTFAPSVAGLVFAAGLLVVLFGTVFAAVHCRGDRGADRRALHHVVDDVLGHRDRGGADRHHHAGRQAGAHVGARHRVRGGDDRLQRPGGICILAGGLRYREQDVQVSGSSLYLSVLIVMATITLIMPNYTLTTPGPVYSAGRSALSASSRCCSTAYFSIPRPFGTGIISSTKPPGRG